MSERPGPRDRCRSTTWSPCAPGLGRWAGKVRFAAGALAQQCRGLISARAVHTEQTATKWASFGTPGNICSRATRTTPSGAERRGAPLPSPPKADSHRARAPPAAARCPRCTRMSTTASACANKSLSTWCVPAAVLWTRRPGVLMNGGVCARRLTRASWSCSSTWTSIRGTSSRQSLACSLSLPSYDRILPRRPAQRQAERPRHARGGVQHAQRRPPARNRDHSHRQSVGHWGTRVGVVSSCP
jgi:hypothetical protein